METLCKADTVSPRPGSIAASSFLSPGVTKSIAGLHCSPAEGGNNNCGPGPTRKGSVMLSVFGLWEQGRGKCERRLRRFALGLRPTGPTSSRSLPAALLLLYDFPFVGLKRTSKYFDRPFPNEHVWISAPEAEWSHRWPRVLQCWVAAGRKILGVLLCQVWLCPLSGPSSFVA